MLRKDIFSNKFRYLSWIGASVIPKLDCMNDGFISREKWLCITDFWDGTTCDLSKEGDAFDKKCVDKPKSAEFGITYMKEKLPFQW